MRTVREWLNRLGGTLRPRRSDDELEEELRLHMELAADDARRRGHTAEEAARAARLRSGAILPAMDALRDQRGLPVLSGVGQDFRLAGRSLRATPLVSAVVIGRSPSPSAPTRRSSLS
jgi:hypothetical protein